jgi:hypothetical protein
MKSGMRSMVLVLCAFPLAFAGKAWAASPPSQAGFSAAELKEFTSLDPIDVHTHIYQTDSTFIAMLRRLNLHVLDVLVADVGDNASHSTFKPLKEAAWQFVSSSQGRASLSTNVDPFSWNDADFPQAAIRSIDRDFVRGAVAATIWANTGMSLKDASGTPALPDDAKLEPIYKDLATRHKTLIAHIGVQDEAWVPNPAAVPSVPVVLQARDRILAGNPKLRVVGAHLGSLKENLDQLTPRLERYPNFAVDTSSRMDWLMTQPRAQVIEFFLKFQDRILYGTDSAFRQKDAAETAIAKFENRYAVDWRYLATADTFEYRGSQVHGLHLPKPVLRKIYHDNAVYWIPGIVK